MAKCFVIAEAGGCHDGDLEKAIRLVYAAKDCGADAVKFQWVSSPERLAERRNAGEYVKHYKLISFDRSWFDVLYDKCQKAGIEFMCTAYLPEDIPVVAKYAKRAKVSSFESGDVAFVREHEAWFEEVVVSYSGGATPHEELHDDRFGKFKSLYCVSAYPCQVDALNLSVMGACGRRHGEVCAHYGEFACRAYDGLSDHTTSVLTGALCVAAGGTICEKHIRLEDTDPKNADWAHSLIADQKHRRDESFYEYAANIRLAESAMGDGQKRIADCEKPMMAFKVRT